MEFNKIYVNGCSFSCGGGFNWDDVKQIYKSHLNIEILNHSDVSYPKLIAQELGFNLINHAILGGSSNRLVRTTYQYIFENINTLNNTLFLLEIPPFWRDELYSNELNRLINLTISSVHSYSDNTDYANGHDIKDLRKIHGNLTNYFYNFVDLTFEKNKMMSHLFGLISYMKLSNIKFKLIDNGDFYNFYERNNIMIDENDFVWFNKRPLCHYMNENEILIKHETDGLSRDEHLGIEGNKIVANKIIEHLYENKTLFG